jgi:hypothetical protein
VRVTAATEARRVAESPWIDRAARFGLVAKGVMYGLIAMLATKIALRIDGESADQEGAVRTVAEQPLGRGLVAALALGFAAYALWRLTQAVVCPGGKEGASAAFARASYAVRAGVYSVLCYTTIRLLIGLGAGTDETSMTARLLSLPIGVPLVVAVGLVFLLAAYRQARSGVRRSFRDGIDRMAVEPERWLVVLGVVGHLARTVVFALVGVFLIRAAVTFDPNEAVGFDGALREIAAGRYGTALLLGMAAGLACYAGYTLVLAKVGRPRAIN